MTFFASGAARQLTRRSTRHYPCALMVPRDGIKGNAGEAALERGCPRNRKRRIRATACHWETGKAGTNQDPRARRPAIDPRSKQPHRGVSRCANTAFGGACCMDGPTSGSARCPLLPHPLPHRKRRAGTPPACTARLLARAVLYRSRPPACAAPTPATAACSARSRDSPITDNKTGAARRAPRSTHAQPDHNDSLMKIRHLLATSAATALLSPPTQPATPRLHNRPRPPKAPTCRRST